MKQFQQTYSVSVDQEDGFGFGGCFTKMKFTLCLKNTSILLQKNMIVLSKMVGLKQTSLKSVLML